MTALPRLHQVAVLALPGVLALDFGIPVHAFGNWDGGPYAVTACTEVPGPVRVDGAPALLIEHGLGALASADTIVVPARHARSRHRSGCVRPWPRPRPVAPAWSPSARVRSCSLPRACSTAGAAAHRTGGQAQFIDRPALPQRTGALDELRAWALRHLDEPLTVDRMARRACLSRRTLIRRFHDETGLAPMHVQTPYRRPAQHLPRHVPPPRARGRRGRSRGS